jgi:transposase-like protein
MATKRATRKRYSDRQRSEILATANKEGLTAAAVQKKFGVTPVTYYSWRRKAGSPRRRGRPATSGNGSLGGKVRRAVEARMAATLPGLIDQEVKRYLDRELGTGARRRSK